MRMNLRGLEAKREKPGMRGKGEGEKEKRKIFNKGAIEVRRFFGKTRWSLAITRVNARPNLLRVPNCAARVSGSRVFYIGKNRHWSGDTLAAGDFEILSFPLTFVCVWFLSLGLPRHYLLVMASSAIPEKPPVSETPVPTIVPSYFRCPLFLSSALDRVNRWRADLGLPHPGSVENLQKEVKGM